VFTLRVPDMLSRIYDCFDQFDCSLQPRPFDSQQSVNYSQLVQMRGCCPLDCNPVARVVVPRTRMNSAQQSGSGKLIQSLRSLQKIGDGSFGNVYRAVEPRSGNEFALKIIKNPYEPEAQKEISILMHLGSCQEPIPNVIACLDTRVTYNDIRICMPLIKGKSLYDVMDSHKPLPILDSRAKKIAKGMAVGIHHLHKHGIVHRDLKPENVMIEQQDTPVIIDFGLSNEVSDQDERMTTVCGSLGYAAPEVLDGKAQGYTMAADDWSLGVILHALLTLYLPFPSDKYSAHLKEIKTYKNSGDARNKIYQFNRLKGHKAKDLIHSLLQSDEHQRLKTFNADGHNEVINHKWFKGSK